MTCDSNDPVPSQAEMARRQTLKIALAILVVWFALKSTSDGGGLPLAWDPIVDVAGTATLQWDGVTALPPGQVLSFDPQPRRIFSAELYVVQANLDPDADPDGWRATVVLRDQQDFPVSLATRGTFELLEYAGRDLPKRASLTARASLRWTTPLQFDPDGVALVTLPANWKTRRWLGWDTDRRLHESTRPLRYRERIRPHRYFVTQDLRDRIDYPTVGWLKVTVTVPGQPSARALAPIELRPQVLVDTSWRYR